MARELLLVPLLLGVVALLRSLMILARPSAQLQSDTVRRRQAYRWISGAYALILPASFVIGATDGGRHPFWAGPAPKPSTEANISGISPRLLEADHRCRAKASKFARSDVRIDSTARGRTISAERFIYLDCMRWRSSGSS